MLNHKKFHSKSGRNKIKRLVLILAGMSLVIPLAKPAGQTEVKKFSLKSVREYAIQHNYDAKKSQLDVAAAQKKMKETVASGLPQVSSAVGYNNNLKLATSLIPNFFEGKPEEKIPVQFGTQHNANINITVRQKLFSGSYIIGLKTSSIYERLAEEGLERTQLSIKETVTSTYYLILVSEESQRILEASLTNLEKTYYEIQERYKEGFVAETDVDLILIAVTSLKNYLQNVRKQTKMAYQLLQFQMGLDLNEKIELTDTLEDILTEVDMANTLKNEFDLSKNIDFRLLNTQERLAELALKNEKANYLPTIDAFFTYQQNAFRDAFNFFSSQEKWFPMQILGISIDIPIFKSGAQKARVQQASIALDQARNARQQASQGLLLEASQAKIALTAANDNYLNIKDNMALSKKVYEVTLVKYKEGLSSSMDLTQAHDKYLLSQSDYIQAMSELLNAKNKLDKLHNSY